MKKRRILLTFTIIAVVLLSACTPSLSTEDFETINIFTENKSFVFDRIEGEEKFEIQYDFTVEEDIVSSHSTIKFDYGKVVSESTFDKNTIKPITAHKGNSYNLDPTKNWDIYAEYDEPFLKMRAETPSEKETKSLTLPKHYIDNEALLFTVGALTLEQDYEKDINISIIDAGEIVAFRVKNMGLEEITVAYGTFECIKVEIKYTGMVLGRKPSMYTWYSNDENRYPIKYENRGIFLELKSVS